MHDVSTRPIQGAGQGTAQGGASAGQTAQQAAGDAARLQAEAQRIADQAQQAALRELEAAQAAQGAQGSPAEIIRIGPGGQITTVRPGDEAVTVGVGDAQGSTEGAPFVFEPRIPEGVVVISVTFFIMLAVIIVGFPVARAFARRMDRSAAPPSRASGEQAEQLRHIQAAVDAMAVEVERISENQRYVTRLLAERGAVAPAALGARQLAPEESGRP